MKPKFYWVQHPVTGIPVIAECNEDGDWSYCGDDRVYDEPILLTGPLEPPK